MGEFKKGKEDLEREIRDAENDLRKAAEAEVEEKKEAPAKATEPEADSE